MNSLELLTPNLPSFPTSDLGNLQMAAVSCSCSCSGSPLLITLCHYTHDDELLLYKLVDLQCTGLTGGGSIYPHIDALQVSTGTKYVTAEDSCCGALRVTVEKYGSNSSRSK